MIRTRLSTGSTFEDAIGYSRAVIAGDWIFISGTTGYDYSRMVIPDTIEEQTEACFRNIESVLRQAGSSLSDVVRVTYILPDASDFPATWPILKRHFGSIRPAATMISAGLTDPAMKIEIEVTALRNQQTGTPDQH